MLVQITIYCGIPVGADCFQVAETILNEDKESEGGSFNSPFGGGGGGGGGGHNMNQSAENQAVFNMIDQLSNTNSQLSLRMSD